MHNAPAVSYPVGRSHFQVQLILSMALLGLLVIGAWVRQTDPLGGRHGAVAVLWLCSTGLALWRWWRTPAAALAWDGQHWSWSAAGETWLVQPEVVLDLQANLLLRLHADAVRRTLWAWPQRRLVPACWLAFRRAVFAAPAGPGRPAADPTATPESSAGLPP